MIEIDPQRGHIAVYVGDGSRPFASVLDMGADCAIVSDLGGYSPEQAVELGAALVMWSNRKRRQRRNSVREAHGLGPEVIVLDDGTWLEPDAPAKPTTT